MATKAGRIIGEFPPALFRILHPIKFCHIDDHVLNHVPGAGDCFGGDILDKISVRKMAIDALSHKALWVYTAVYRILP